MELEKVYREELTLEEVRNQNQTKMVKMKKISDFIHHLECPVADGIMFPDETIQLLDIAANWTTPYVYKIKVAAQTSVSRLMEEGDLVWCNCDILTRTIDLKYDVEVIAGATSWGGDGFVAVLDLKSKSLIWLAFFTCSNPFNKAEIIGDEIYATSIHNCVWKFKLNNPADVSVECC